MLETPSQGGRHVDSSGPALLTLLVMVIAIAALYVGRDIFIPFALAILLSFALGPIAIRLRRWGLGRIPSVLVAVCLAFLGLGGFAVLVGSQSVQLVQQLPTYQSNIQVKIRSMQAAAPSGGMLDRAATVLHELSREIAGEPGQEARGADALANDALARRPIPVRIEEPSPSMFKLVGDIAGPLLGPLGTAGLVIVFVFIMLLEREDLRNRFIRLVSGGDLYLTTEALDEAAQRVSRYLLMQLIVNITYGLPIGLGLYFIGVPNALLWGVLATVLRFIPYIGPFIAAFFPIALAVAVAPGWGMVLWTLGLFVAIELLSNNIVEPWLYGSSTGISALALILAAIFWTTLWGPVGLLLSTPLTVCLVVMGRYIPRLQFLDVLLGSEPVLTAPEHLYQRMLAGDPDEGEEIAREQLKERPLVAVADEVILPALCLAERDRQRKVLTGDRRVVITESCLRVVAALADYESAEDTVEGADQDALAPHEARKRAAPVNIVWAGTPVLCIAGWTGLDRAAATLLGQLLAGKGIGTRVLPPEAISPEGIGSFDVSGVELICLVYLSQAGVMRARQAYRRVQRQAPTTKIMAVFLNAQIDPAKERDQNAALPIDFIATSLSQACEQITQLATSPVEAPMVPPPLPAGEPERLAALKQLNMLDTAPEEMFDRVTRRLAAAFKAPIALLTLIDEERQFWKSATGLPEDLALARQAPRETSICGHVVASSEMLVIPDVLQDTRFANNPFLRERGIRFYAGAPLRTPAGYTIGSLCVMDTEPRTISERERALLQMIADEVMAEIEKRSPAARPGPDADRRHDEVNTPAPVAR